MGGGVFQQATILPVSLAWEVFGAANGAESLEQMRARISKYRRERLDPRTDYRIGCRILVQPFFFDEYLWIPVPESWSRTIVVGKGYSTDGADGLFLWEKVQDRIQAAGQTHFEQAGGEESRWQFAEEQARYGGPTLIEPRLGQGSFRIAVTEAYQRCCAVTAERALPVLEAAHIRPYSQGGEHRVDNGILLRRDVHVLFDRGYVTVTPEHRFEVSPRIHDEFDNGRYYYTLHGKELILPPRTDLRPNSENIEWHNSFVFTG